MKLREPAAWVALGALVLNLLLAVVALATFGGSFVSAAWVLSARVANPVPLLVLAVLVSFCVLRERTPHARQLTIISVVAGVIAVLLGLVLALFGFGGNCAGSRGARCDRAAGDLDHRGWTAHQTLSAAGGPAAVAWPVSASSRIPRMSCRHRRRPTSGCNQPGTPTRLPAQPGGRRATRRPGPRQLAGVLTCRRWAGNRSLRKPFLYSRFRHRPSPLRNPHPRRRSMSSKLVPKIHGLTRDKGSQQQPPVDWWGRPQS